MSTDLVAAIDIGATKTLLAVRSVAALSDGWPRGEVMARSSSGMSPDDLVAWVVAGVRRAGSEGRLAGIGVAAPGPLDAAHGVVTRSSNLGWQDVPLAALLQEGLGAPVSLEDDANAAALGEWHFGAGRDADPMGYLTVSSGIGGGVVIAGEIVRGASGNAGEVGHLLVDPAGPRCACGRRGDVESYAGGAALARRARRTWPGRTSDDGRRSPRSAAEVFSAARAGDPDARRLADDAAAALAVSLAALAAVVDPEVIVVGGSIGLGQRRLIGRATTLARRRVLRENASSLRVVPAALDHQSVLAGSADRALRLLRGG